MRLRPVTHSQKCCVLIDGNYIDRLSKSVRFDFLEFVKFLRAKFQITNFVYFTIVPLYEDVFPKRRLLDWLSYNGFVVKEKTSKRYGTAEVGDACGSLSLEIALCALDACVHTDGFVLVTDDSDMCAAIFALQRKNKWVALVGSGRGSGPGLCNDLRRAADVCFPISEVFAPVGKPNAS